MKGIIKLIGCSIIGGAACQAGASLWNNVLESKVHDLAEDLKKKKEAKSKIIKFEKRS